MNKKSKNPNLAQPYPLNRGSNDKWMRKLKQSYMELINVDSPLWCWPFLNIYNISWYLLYIWVLGYKVQSIMCATNSIFGLKERINSSNSPQLSKDWRGEHKKEKLSQEPGKNVLLSTEGLYQQYLKIAQHHFVLQKQRGQYQLQFFFYQVIVFSWALLASTNTSATLKLL